MAIEIVDFPIENGGSFHRFLYVYQRLVETKKNGVDANPGFLQCPG